MERWLHAAARQSPPPLLALAVGWVAGDAVAISEVCGRIGAVVVLALGLAAFVWRRWALACALIGLGFTLGLARADQVYRPYVRGDDVAALDLPAEVDLVAEVVDPVERRDAGVRLLLAVQRVRRGGAWEEVRGRVFLTIGTARHLWAAGDTLHGRLRLRRPRNFGNPGEFDYEKLLARRGVYVSAFAYDDARLRQTPTGAAGLMQRWRRQVSELFGREAPPLPAAVLRALIIGTANELPDALRQAFTRAGVSHVLSISGLHIGLVAAAAFVAWRWLLGRSMRLLLSGLVPKLAVALALLPVLAYAGIAGANFATRRAVWMSLLVLGAVLLDRLENLYVVLSVAALAVLIVAPGASQEISFQLSFVAVLGLLLGVGKLRRWWPVWAERRLLSLRPRRARWEHAVLQFAVVTLSATLFTAPLVAFHFNAFSVAAPLANLVVTPILGSLVVALGLLAALLVPWFELPARLCVWLATPLIEVSLWLVESIAAYDASSVRVVTPGWGQLAAFYAALLATLTLAGRRRLLLTSVLLLLLVGETIRRAAALHPAGELRVTFLSVGQGDSTVIETPGGEVVVVDGGGLRSPNFDVGARLVAPYLWGRGQRRADVLVVSHPQWDHYAGLAFLAEEMAPRELWWNGTSASTAGYRRLSEAVVRAAGVATVVAEGFERDIGGVRFVALGPPSARDDLGVNDGSLVLVLEYAGRCILLPGDIEATGEAVLVAQGRGRLRCDIAKVPHHGSATSSGVALIDEVRPELAIVSAGWGNRFGFPQPDVVRRWRAAGATVVRTDVAGAVSVWVTADGRWGYELVREGN